jgi:hypothetical protein
MKTTRLWILLLIVVLLLAGCEKPGEGKRAEAGYTACEPVLAALADYQADTGRYPDSLDSLVPGYLAELPAEVTGYPLVYERADGKSYTLRFSYEKPGMNTCAYQPDSGWSCSGYY